MPSSAGYQLLSILFNLLHMRLGDFGKYRLLTHIAIRADNYRVSKYLTLREIFLLQATGSRLPQRITFRAPRKSSSKLSAAALSFPTTVSIAFCAAARW